MAKVSLPLAKLNEALDGGIDEGSSVLLLADLSVDKMKFGSALADYRLREGDSLVYYINNKLPKYAKGHLDEYEERKDKVTFVDGFSPTIDRESDDEFVVSSKLTGDKESYIVESGNVVKEALEAQGDEQVSLLVDSIDSWAGYWDALYEFVDTLRPAMRETGAVAYYLLPNLGFDEEGSEAYQRLEQTFDYVLHLKGLERDGRVLKYVEIRKPEHETKVPFEVTRQGIATYIPKILVTGPFDAGKSTTVQSMSDTSVSVDRLGTTVALDHGKVERQGLRADVFGTPGQKKFDWAMGFLGASIFGCFVVVDSRDPDFERAEEMAANVRSRGVPIIVLANFQNKDDAMSPEEIEEEMGIETIGVDALHGEGLDEALDELFDQILSQHSWYYT